MTGRATIKKLVVVAAVVAAALGLQAAPAGAAQIGWVLAASGSAQCIVRDGTNNHVICYKYPPGGGAATEVSSGYFPYACLGGAYMVSGNNAGTPAQLIIRNVPGYYCGWHSSLYYSGLIRAGTCWNGAQWVEGQTWFNTTVMQRIGNVYPAATPTGTFPTSGCASTGSSQVGFYIY